MVKRSLPGLQLEAFFELGEDGWNDEVDENFRKLSFICGGAVRSSTTPLPVTGQQGDIYIVPDNQNFAKNVAIWDGNPGQESWVFYPPMPGWLFYIQDRRVNLQFTGSVWVELQGSGSGATTLGQLRDVDTSKTNEGYVLGRKNDGTFHMQAPTQGQVAKLGDLQDVSVTGATLNNVLAAWGISPDGFLYYTMRPVKDILPTYYQYLNIRPDDIGREAYLTLTDGASRPGDSYYSPKVGIFIGDDLRLPNRMAWEIKTENVPPSQRLLTFAFRETNSQNEASYTRRIIFDSDGGLYFGEPITDGNRFYGYETGTFTPTLETSDGELNLTYTLREGIYTKIGNLVFIGIQLAYNGYPGPRPNSILYVGGLPFTCKNGAESLSFNLRQVTFSFNFRFIYARAWENRPNLYVTVVLSNDSVGSILPRYLNDSGYIMISGTYQVDD